MGPHYESITFERMTAFSGWMSIWLNQEKAGGRSLNHLDAASHSREGALKNDKQRIMFELIAISTVTTTQRVSSRSSNCPHIHLSLFVVLAPFIDIHSSVAIRRPIARHPSVCTDSCAHDSTHPWRNKTQEGKALA